MKKSEHYTANTPAAQHPIPTVRCLQHEYMATNDQIPYSCPIIAHIELLVRELADSEGAGRDVPVKAIREQLEILRDINFRLRKQNTQLATRVWELGLNNEKE
jgi:hypothetical protein